MLALAVAVTGIVATMPYIALQLVGIEVVIGALGFDTKGFVGDLPLIIAFAILAAYTYTSGLRAPAMIAVVKDVLIYITIIAAIIVIPAQLGGFGHIFSVGAAGQAAAQGARRREPERLQRLRDARGRLGARAVPVSALGHGDAVVELGQHDPPQHGAAAGVFAGARPARAARLHGARRRA